MGECMPKPLTSTSPSPWPSSSSSSGTSLRRECSLPGFPGPAIAVPLGMGMRLGTCCGALAGGEAGQTPGGGTLPSALVANEPGSPESWRQHPAGWELCPQAVANPQHRFRPQDLPSVALHKRGFVHPLLPLSRHSRLQAPAFKERFVGQTMAS